MYLLFCDFVKSQAKLKLKSNKIDNFRILNLAHRWSHLPLKPTHLLSTLSSSPPAGSSVTDLKKNKGKDSKKSLPKLSMPPKGSYPQCERVFTVPKEVEEVGD